MSGIGLGLKAAGLLARASGISSAAGAALKRIPPKAWYALAIGVALAAAFFIHQHLAHKAIAAAKLEQKQADDAATAEFLAAAHADALEWKSRAEQKGAAIATSERTQHEQDLSSNAALADALQLRGPGAAASHCGPDDRSGSAAGAGGHVDASSGAGATVAPVPDPERVDIIALPFDPTVALTLEHDDLLSEVKRWRDNDAKQRAAWSAMKAEPANSGAPAEPAKPTRKRFRLL